MQRYYLFLLLGIMVLSLIAQGRVQRVFNQYAQVSSRSGVTGAQLAPEERRYLRRPVLGFGVEDGEFGVGDAVCPNPDVEQTFAHETEHAAVVGRVGRDIQPFFQLEEDVEEPGTIAVEKGARHDEHVETVSLS